MDKKAIAKKTVKVAGAVTAATGIVALSAVLASGVAVGAMIEGFKAAGCAVKDMLAEKDLVSESDSLAESDLPTENDLPGKF